MGSWKLAIVVSAQQGQVGWRRLQRSSARTISFQVYAMA
jgi:hypothetical protein